MVPAHGFCWEENRHLPWQYPLALSHPVKGPAWLSWWIRIRIGSLNPIDDECGVEVEGLCPLLAVSKQQGTAYKCRRQRGAEC